ncbi:putative mannan synthase 9 [Morella rubra]|uniref:Putative mannan synthase 9 n=1 Tax=Morella rubra TaxID=262757 RepID=A0A6A1W475_9ROSI|nr:putative mannan synthase 9 [Morella rubra]
MALHRSKATIMGLLEASRVNEWIVTEKLGDAFKAKASTKAPRKPKFRIRESGFFNEDNWTDVGGIVDKIGHIDTDFLIVLIMGEKDTVTEVAETVANGTVQSVLPEKMDEAVTGKEEEQNGVKDIEEDKKELEKAEAVKMDEDTEVKEDEEIKEGNKKDETESLSCDLRASYFLLH